MRRYSMKFVLVGLIIILIMGVICSLGGNVITNWEKNIQETRGAEKTEQYGREIFQTQNAEIRHLTQEARFTATPLPTIEIGKHMYQTQVSHLKTQAARATPAP